MAESKRTIYELGQLRRPSGDFPHGSWCVYVKEGEGRRRFGLGISLREPKARAEERLAEWIRCRERALFSDGTQTIGEIMDLYFTNRLTDGKSVEKEQRLWRSRLAPVFAHRKPQDINLPVIVAGKERSLAHQYAWERSRQNPSHVYKMGEGNITRATICHELNILRTGINWAAKQTLIDPVRVWMPRRAAPRRTLLTVGQLRALLDECKAPHLKLFVMLAICTGQRKTAILDLTWNRVDMKAREIDFRLNRDQDDILDSGGMKGRAIVPIGARLLKELETAWLWRTTDHVIEFNGAPVGDIKTGLNLAMKRAGIKNRDEKRGRFFGAHAIRHSVATIIADKGIELRQIQKLLGHEDFGTTDKIYASYTADYLSAAVGVVDDFLEDSVSEGEEAEGEIFGESGADS